MKNEILKKVKERDSGIELLRVFAACAVIYLHFCFPAAFGALRSEYTTLPIDKTIILGVFECVSICAVDVFILITGYFLATSSRRTIGKPLGLLLQLILIKIGVWILGVALGDYNFSLAGLVVSGLPRSYFVFLYIALYLISPYYNIVLTKLSIKNWKVFLIITLSLFSVWELFLNIGDDLVNINLKSMSFISHWGGGCGHTFVNFSLLYCLGAFLRCNKISLTTVKSLLGFCVTTFAVLIWFLLEVQNKTEIASYNFSYYNNPLVILQSVFVFLLFRGISFKNKFVNEIAKGAFTCYLINGVLLSRFGGEVAVLFSPIKLIAFLIFGAIITYFIAYILYKLFTYCTDWLLKKLDKFEIDYIEQFG